MVTDVDAPPTREVGLHSPKLKADAKPTSATSEASGHHLPVLPMSEKRPKTRPHRGLEAASSTNTAAALAYGVDKTRTRPFWSDLGGGPLTSPCSKSTKWTANLRLVKATANNKLGGDDFDEDHRLDGRRIQEGHRH